MFEIWPRSAHLGQVGQAPPSSATEPGKAWERPTLRGEEQHADQKKKKVQRA